MSEELQVTGKVEEVISGTTKAGANYKTYVINGLRFNQFKNINEEIKIGDEVMGMFSKTEKEDKIYRNLSVLGKYAPVGAKEFKSAETIPQRKDDYPHDDYSRGAIFGMLVNNTFLEMREQGKNFSDSPSDCEVRFNTIFDKLKKVVLEKRKKELGE